MFNIIRRPGWVVSERHVTPESVFLNRRYFLKQMGITSAGSLSLPLVGCSKANEPAAVTAVAETKATTANTLTGKYPYPRKAEFNPGWPLTNEKVAGTYNNFYEFSTTKERVRQLVDKFVTTPWSLEIGGLVEKPMTLDVQELIDTMPMEERVYRFRCVEAWAMIVPWTGFPLSKLIEKISPKPEARFIRFQTFNRPDQSPGWARLIQQGYPLPYNEGLRLDEAMNPLTMVVTGIYGKPLPKQHGAPIRIIVPWKYGYKSIKSIVKIELVTQQPATLWETLAPNEYPFESNVNPAVPHPRWSQTTERMIDSGDRVRTQPYNGYGNYVAKLYAK